MSQKTIPCPNICEGCPLRDTVAKPTTMTVVQSVTEGTFSADRRSVILEARNGEPVGPTILTVGVTNADGEVGGSFDVDREDWRDGTLIRTFDNCQEPLRWGLLGRKKGCPALWDLRTDIPPARHRLLKRTVALGMLVLPFAGAVAGYLKGSDVERDYNTHHAGLAAGYEQCLAAAEAKAAPGQTIITVELGGLASQTLVDCDLTVSARQKKGIQEGKDAEVATGKLKAMGARDGIPQTAELDTAKITAAIDSERRDATDFNSSAPILGALTGGTGTLLAEAVLFLLVDNREDFAD